MSIFLTVLVFWSKYRAIHSFLDKTPLEVFLISDTHVLHVYCGWVIFVCGFVHSIFHLIRYVSLVNVKSHLLC